jgi:hypothetical protein
MSVALSAAIGILALGIYAADSWRASHDRGT